MKFIVDGHTVEGESDELRKLLGMSNYKIDMSSVIPISCRGCPNHPSNGGSGFCNCTLGMPFITCK